MYQHKHRYGDRARCGYNTPRLSYDNIRETMERGLAQQNKGLLTENEIRHIVGDWKDQRVEYQPDTKMTAKEVSRFKIKFKKYNVLMVLKRYLCLRRKAKGPTESCTAR